MQAGCSVPKNSKSLVLQNRVSGNDVQHTVDQGDVEGGTPCCNTRVEDGGRDIVELLAGAERERGAVVVNACEYARRG